MSAKSVKQPVEEQATSVETVTDKFAIEKLRKNCTILFGVSSSTFDGALYGCTEEKLTISECKTIINTWLGKE